MRKIKKLTCPGCKKKTWHQIIPDQNAGHGYTAICLKPWCRHPGTHRTRYGVVISDRVETKHTGRRPDIPDELF